jgi:hypothetical protein
VFFGIYIGRKCMRQQPLRDSAFLRSSFLVRRRSAMTSTLPEPRVATHGHEPLSRASGSSLGVEGYIDSHFGEAQKRGKDIVGKTAAVMIPLLADRPTNGQCHSQ